MKFLRKLALSLIIMVSFLTFFSLNTVCNITIGDSSFPAKDGESFEWKFTYPTAKEGDLAKFIVESIHQDLDNSINCLVVNCTIQIYDSSADQWSFFLNDGFYLAYNKSLNYLNSNLFSSAFLLIVPIPVNLTLIAETVETGGYWNASIMENQLILSQEPPGPPENEIWERYYTINSGGFVTKFENRVNSTLYEAFELVVIDEIIPLGHYYIIPLLVSTIGLIYLIKKKDIAH